MTQQPYRFDPDYNAQRVQINHRPSLSGLKKLLGNSDLGKKAKIFLILLTILMLLWTVSVSSAAGGYYLAKRKYKEEGSEHESENDNEDSEDEDQDDSDDEEEDGEVEGAESDSSEAPGGASDEATEGGSRDDSGGTSGSTDEETETPAPTTQPSLTQVLNNMKQVKSYRIRAESDMSGEKSIIEAEYQAPDREHVKETVNGKVTEEIAIGDKVYYKEHGGSWKAANSAKLTGFHDQLTTMLDFELTPKGEKNGYWVYSMHDAFADVEVLVDKKTNLFYKLTLSVPGQMGANVEFRDYNKSLVIKAPI